MLLEACADVTTLGGVERLLSEVLLYLYVDRPRENALYIGDDSCSLSESILCEKALGDVERLLEV